MDSTNLCVLIILAFSEPLIFNFFLLSLPPAGGTNNHPRLALNELVRHRPSA